VFQLFKFFGDATKKNALQAYLNAIKNLFRNEFALLMTIIASVAAEGLEGEKARKEVIKRFKDLWKETIKDWLLNLLLEIAVGFFNKDKKNFVEIE